MSEIIINVENVQKAFREAGENPAIQELLINLFGKENVEPEHPKDVRERIKTFEDAYNELGCEHPFCKVWDSIYQVNENDGCEDIKDVIAYHKLRIIVAALNEGWKPESTQDEYLYYPYFCFYTKERYGILSAEEKEKCCAVGRVRNNAVAYGGLSCAGASDGSRLAFKSLKLAKYAGNQFIDIYKDFVASYENIITK